jgi:UDP-2,4-diacetamido-2,4,6-trideoxy-beta-L-altropyranose hydrolase
MMLKKILFRADSSSRIGLGHIKRDLVLASRLDSDEIHFAAQELPGNINHEIPYPVHSLRTANVQELIKLCKHLDIDHLIVDNYEFTLEDEKKIKAECSVRLSVFDDTYQEHFCDEVINHNLGSRAKKYLHKVPSFCKISLISPLIRQAFFEERQHTRSKEGLFLCLGGSDFSNITLKALKVLKRHRFHINVALSSSNPNLPTLEAYANVNRWIRLHVDGDIPRLLNSCELAIVTPSVLAAEALFMNASIIAIQTAENQIEVTKFLRRKRITTLKSTQIHKLANRGLFQSKQISLFGLPARQSEDFTLHKASQYDLLDLFDLANDPFVRKNSFSTQPITLEEHTKWFNDLLKNTSVCLYTVRSDSNALIAQIRFNKTGKKTIISLSISKDFRGKRMAEKIIKKGCSAYLKEYGNTLIEAQIKEENTASEKSFQKAGFEYLKKDNNTLYYSYGKKDE